MERGLRNTNRSRDHRLRFTIWSFAVGLMLVALLVGAAVAYVHYSLVLY
jgi:Mn2+/Fe2+ NRAMP family transporter